MIKSQPTKSNLECTSTQAFQELKDILTSTPVLRSPNVCPPFTLQTPVLRSPDICLHFTLQADASDEGAGTALSQKSEPFLTDEGDHRRLVWMDRLKDGTLHCKPSTLWLFTSQTERMLMHVSGHRSNTPSWLLDKEGLGW